MQGALTGFWGKLTLSDGEVTAWHPLEDHCADVAACAEVLLQRTSLRRRLAALAGLDDLDEVQVARLCVIAALHDVGKFNQHFQNKGRPGATPTAGHVREASLLFDPYQQVAERERLVEALDLHGLASWGEGDAAVALLLAAIGHHGRPAPVRPSKVTHDPARWKTLHGLDPFEGIASLRASSMAWFPAAAREGAPLPATPAFAHGFAGLVTLADWMGSDAKVFPFTEPGDWPRLTAARAWARAFARDLHLDPSASRAALGEEPPGFERVSEHAPHAAQRATLDLPLERGGSLALIESETGSGKTEAALARFARLHHAGLVDGMYFALPTRTAATQIHGRVTVAVKRAFGPSAPPVVLAVPGYLHVDERAGRRLPGFEVLWNDDLDRRFRFRAWASEHPKRFLAGAVAVGTIDQALLSTLMVDHAHLRATSLLRQLLVVDEVHASDAYMTRLLEGVLSHHLAAGGHALLMSATLGSATRDRLFALVEKTDATPYEHARREPYPAVWQAARGAARSVVDVGEAGRAKTVRFELEPAMESPERAAGLALDAARRGARVIVLRNTVKGALETQRALESLAAGDEAVLFQCEGRVTLHHSRFARGDRERLDRALEERFGKGSPSRGCVVVATQTVQQSLDLDADLMVTDLCPMDVLLQRVGRLHRHDRARPEGFAEARCVVLTPAERDLAALIRRDGRPRGEHGLGTVYDDLRVIDATWRQIVARSVVCIPEMNRELVEATTHPEVLGRVGDGDPRWKQHQSWVRGQFYGDRRVAGDNLIPRDEGFGEMSFPDAELGRRVSTRLGEGDRRVTLAPAATSPFGEAVKELTIPAHLCRSVPPEVAEAPCAKGDEGFAFRFGPVDFTYDRLGLRPAGAVAALPPTVTDEDETDA